jgi:hypothetical protein
MVRGVSDKFIEAFLESEPARDVAVEHAGRD